jgi:hypothetical protein
MIQQVAAVEHAARGLGITRGDVGAVEVEGGGRKPVCQQHAARNQPGQAGG